MLDDTLGEDFWLAGRDEQAPAGTMENGECVFDFGTNAIFIEPLIGKSFAKKAQGGGGRSAVAQQFLEAFEKRRADTPNQFIFGWNLSIEPVERVLNGTCDSRLWVGQSSIEVKKISSMKPILPQPRSIW